ncbi:MAG: lysylphosphatidylglycerol synthase transmembrane domain-containing protein [Actinomycetota bacterium]|nr:lysylphosphatidylglycerol synthase transmembrane domain-containing protein [Actinomycetota bacterium]
MTETGDLVLRTGDRLPTPPPGDGRGGLRRDRFFVPDALAPRRRRPVDVVALVVWAVAAALLAWAALGSPPADQRVTSATSSLPDWLQMFAWIGYTGAGLYATGLVIATLVGGGTRRGILRDILVAIAVVVSPALALSQPVAHDWPDVLPELFSLGNVPAFPAFRLAVVAAVVLVQAPHLTAPYRRAGRWAVIGAAVGTLLLGFTSLTGMLGGLSVAFVGVHVVRVAFGSPVGLPTVGQLATSLSDLGVRTSALVYADPVGSVGRARAVSDDGRDLEITVYGRDAADSARAERMWRMLWYRRSGHSVAATPLSQVEHEALLTLMARDRVTVPAVIAAGADDDGNALLVTRPPDGRALGGFEPSTIDDAQLAATWDALAALHGARIAHGAIGPTTVVVGDHDVGFRELADATLSPTEQQRQADVVALLATTAASAGVVRALDAATAALGPSAAASLPYFQNAVLPPEMRRWLSDHDLELDELRDALAERLAVDAPELADVRRISVTDVVSVVFAVFAANALISQFASVGFETIADQFAAASVGWLVATFVIRLAGYTTSVVSLRAIVVDPIPAGPTTLLQVAKSYVGLVVPTTVGRAAMDVRFMQRLGVPTAAALAQGPLISFVGFLVEVGLLLLTFSTASAALDDADLAAPDIGGLIALAVAIAVVAVVVVLAVPRLRTTVVPFVRDAIGSVRSVVTSPSRLLTVAAGELADRLVAALALAAVVAAFGASAEVTFAKLVFVNVGVGLLAGLAPVPGGIGVAEAMLAGLLTAIGLPSDQAFAIAITYRVLTSYLPPVLGFFSLRWLRDNGYL